MDGDNVRADHSFGSFSGSPYSSCTSRRSSNLSEVDGRESVTNDSKFPATQYSTDDEHEASLHLDHTVTCGTTNDFKFDVIHQQEPVKHQSANVNNNDILASENPDLLVAHERQVDAQYPTDSEPGVQLDGAIMHGTTNDIESEVIHQYEHEKPQSASVDPNDVFASESPDSLVAHEHQVHAQYPSDDEAGLHLDGTIVRGTTNDIQSEVVHQQDAVKAQSEIIHRQEHVEALSVNDDHNSVIASENPDTLLAHGRHVVDGIVDILVGNLSIHQAENITGENHDVIKNSDIMTDDEPPPVPDCDPPSLSESVHDDSAETFVAMRNHSIAANEISSDGSIATKTSVRLNDGTPQEQSAIPACSNLHNFEDTSIQEASDFGSKKLNARSDAMDEEMKPEPDLIHCAHMLHADTPKPLERIIIPQPESESNLLVETERCKSFLHNENSAFKVEDPNNETLSNDASFISSDFRVSDDSSDNGENEFNSPWGSMKSLQLGEERSVLESFYFQDPSAFPIKKKATQKNSDHKIRQSRDEAPENCISQRDAKADSDKLFFPKNPETSDQKAHNITLPKPSQQQQSSSIADQFTKAIVVEPSPSLAAKLYGPRNFVGPWSPLEYGTNTQNNMGWASVGAQAFEKNIVVETTPSLSDKLAGKGCTGLFEGANFGYLKDSSFCQPVGRILNKPVLKFSRALFTGNKTSSIHPLKTPTFLEGRDKTASYPNVGCVLSSGFAGKAKTSLIPSHNTAFEKPKSVLFQPVQHDSNVCDDSTSFEKPNSVVPVFPPVQHDSNACDDSTAYEKPKSVYPVLQPVRHDSNGCDDSTAYEKPQSVLPFLLPVEHDSNVCDDLDCHYECNLTLDDESDHLDNTDASSCDDSKSADNCDVDACGDSSCTKNENEGSVPDLLLTARTSSMSVYESVISEDDSQCLDSQLAATMASIWSINYQKESQHEALMNDVITEIEDFVEEEHCSASNTQVDRYGSTDELDCKSIMYRSDSQIQIEAFIHEKLCSTSNTQADGNGSALQPECISMFLQDDQIQIDDFVHDELCSAYNTQVDSDGSTMHAECISMFPSVSQIDNEVFVEEELCSTSNTQHDSNGSTIQVECMPVCPSVAQIYPETLPVCTRSESSLPTSRDYESSSFTSYTERAKRERQPLKYTIPAFKVPKVSSASEISQAMNSRSNYDSTQNGSLEGRRYGFKNLIQPLSYKHLTSFVEEADATSPIHHFQSDFPNDDEIQYLTLRNIEENDFDVISYTRKSTASVVKINRAENIANSADDSTAICKSASGRCVDNFNADFHTNSENSLQKINIDYSFEEQVDAPIHEEAQANICNQTLDNLDECKKSKPTKCLRLFRSTNSSASESSDEHTTKGSTILSDSQQSLKKRIVELEESFKKTGSSMFSVKPLNSKTPASHMMPLRRIRKQSKQDTQYSASLSAFPSCELLDVLPAEVLYSSCQALPASSSIGDQRISRNSHHQNRTASRKSSSLVCRFSNRVANSDAMTNKSRYEQDPVPIPSYLPLPPAVTAESQKSIAPCLFPEHVDSGMILPSGFRLATTETVTNLQGNSLDCIDQTMSNSKLSSCIHSSTANTDDPVGPKSNRKGRSVGTQTPKYTRSSKTKGRYKKLPRDEMNLQLVNPSSTSLASMSITINIPESQLPKTTPVKVTRPKSSCRSSVYSDVTSTAAMNMFPNLADAYGAIPITIKPDMGNAGDPADFFPIEMQLKDEAINTLIQNKRYENVVSLYDVVN